MLVDTLRTKPAVPRRCRVAAVAGMLLVHAGLLAWSAYRHSPNSDEPGHLVAGLYTWRFGRFDLYPVNTPLVRTPAALPVLLAGAEEPWSVADEQPGVLTLRVAGYLGREFVRANGQKAFWYVTLARWAVIPVSLLGGWVCYRWAGELWGEKAAFLALALWCFSPNVLAHGALISSDCAAAAFGVLAGWRFWKWLHAPDWGTALLAGLALGLAELAKITWLILFGLWPLLWFAWVVSFRPPISACPSRLSRPPLRQLVAMLLVGLFLLNAGYLFEGSFRTLGSYDFYSRALTGHELANRYMIPGNRFRGTVLGDIPLPLPEDYLRGIDRQGRDFEGQWYSYLRGEWRRSGWWYYYLYAAAVKVPLGTWLLGLLAAGWTVRQARCHAGGPRGEGDGRLGWTRECVLLAPPIVVVVLVSSQTAMNHHFRYVLGAFPFVFVAIGRVARAADWGYRKLSVLVAAALLWSVASSLWVYPHSISYFNELAGGPRGGPRHLLGSNIGWRQDLLYLKQWYDEHPESRPLYVDLAGSIEPAILGMETRELPTHGNYGRGSNRFPQHVPPAGWFAVSVENLYGFTDRYACFRKHFQPVATAGYSILIYHITLEEANRMRREMGLPEVEE